MVLESLRCVRYASEWWDSEFDGISDPPFLAKTIAKEGERLLTALALPDPKTFGTLAPSGHTLATFPCACMFLCVPESSTSEFFVLTPE